MAGERRADALCRCAGRDGGARRRGARGQRAELVWLLEHPPLFTAGTSADPAELFNPHGLSRCSRPGAAAATPITAPASGSVYLVLDLEKRGKRHPPLRPFARRLDDRRARRVGVAARREPGRIGIWTGEGASEAKIGAIGVRVRRWVTMHGFAINVAPDLSHFGGIVPCGIAEYGVTSLAALGLDASMERIDAALKRNFPLFLNVLTPASQVA